MRMSAVRHSVSTCIKWMCGLCCAVLVVELALVGRPALADDLSFGSFYSRKHIGLTRRLPPIMNVSGKTIDVAMAKVNGAASTEVELQKAIEGLLTKDGSGVKVESNGPDIVIDCQITEYSAPKIERKTDGKTTTETVVGMLQAVFTIREVRTRRTMASGKVERQISTVAGTTANKEGSYVPQFHNPFQKKEPGDKTIASTLDAQDEMVDSVAKQIASYLVVTPESVDALLAVGKPVDAANKLALKALWTRDLEDLETVTPLTDERQEAYRLYNIGVANEALAYQSQDNKAAIKYLQEASLDYGKAINSRPDEKYFLDPQNRIKTALEHYLPPAPRVEKVADTKPKEEAPLSNEDVVAMVQAQMDPALIMDTIKTAPKVDLDLSANALIKLSLSGVKAPIIQAMQQRVRGTASTPIAAAPAPAPPPAAAPAPKTRTRAKALTSPQPQAQP